MYGVRSADVHCRDAPAPSHSGATADGSVVSSGSRAAVYPLEYSDSGLAGSILSLLIRSAPPNRLVGSHGTKVKLGTYRPCLLTEV